MSAVLLRLTQRYISRRRFQSLLFVLGITLGVAVGVAIDLANGSASRAFELSVSSVTGRATHQIVGTSSGLPTDLYRRIRTELGLRASAPVIDSVAQALSLDGRSVRILGIDPFAEAPFRDYLAPQNMTAESVAGLYDFIVKPNTALVSETMAEREGLQLGDTITLRTRTRSEVTVRIAGLLVADSALSRQAFDNLLLVDIATAQEVSGTPGTLNRIDLILPAGYDLTQIEALLPLGAALTTPSDQRDALAQMTNAFQLNLRALSLLALLVGVFLIYNTVTFSVVQRRPVIGILRSLGTTRRQIFVLILSETMILGSIGTSLGLVAGIILGQGTVRLVSQTINDLYFRMNVANVAIPVASLYKGAAIGIGASLVAALVPSYEATRTPPAGAMQRSGFERHTLKLIPYLTLVALLLAACGLVLLRVNDVTLSFAALFLVLIGCALLTPIAMITTMRLLTPVTSGIFGVLGRMAPRAVVRSLSRTGVAVAALTLAVSVIVGVSVMISSFRQTVTDWLDTTLGADIYISPFSEDSGDISLDLDPAISSELQAIPGVEQVSTVRSVTVTAPGYPDLPPVNLIAPDVDVTHSQRRFKWNAAPNGDYWSALLAGDVIVSEPFAYRRNITRQNNTIALLTDRGEQAFRVVGVYYDYTTDQGNVLMHASIYRQYFDDPFISSIALDLSPGADLQPVLETLETQTLAGTGLQAQSNRALRSSVLTIFDRTFSITVALRLLATIVAFIGILSALMALQLENTRQHGIMRANGMTPRQLRAFTLIQTGLMGMTAGLLALPVGLVLAIILIYVINVRSFGWTMDLTLTPRPFIQAFAVALIAALAAGLYPAWRSSRSSAIQALRSE